jgi:hypothetical protein
MKKLKGFFVNIFAPIYIPLFTLLAIVFLLRVRAIDTPIIITVVIAVIIMIVSVMAVNADLQSSGRPSTPKQEEDGTGGYSPDQINRP